MVEPMNTSRPVRVLVVDEEEPITHILRIALEFEGWDVAVAHSGAEAIASDFEPDIVLLDMMLPDQQGTDVVAALREAGSTALVVFLTGRDQHYDRTAAYAAGADLYLTKPFGVEEVVDHLVDATRRMGLAPTSRRIDGLVLDLEEGKVWRRHELVALDSLQVELLRELDRNRGRRLSLGELTLAAARRDIRMSRDLAARLLERMRSVFAAAGSRALRVDELGWMLA